MNILEPNQSGSADREAWRGEGEGGEGGRGDCGFMKRSKSTDIR